MRKKTKSFEIRQRLRAGQTTSEIRAQTGFKTNTIKRAAWDFRNDPERYSGDLQPSSDPAPAAPAGQPDDNPPIAKAAQQESEDMAGEDVEKIYVKLEQIRQDLNDDQHSHKPGLCDKDTCHPCVTSRREWGAKVAQEVRDHLKGELFSACQWGDSKQLLDAVNDTYERWVAAGRPKWPERQSGLRVDGLLITS